MGSRKKPQPVTADDATDQVKFEKWLEGLRDIYQGIAHWAYNRPVDITPSLSALDHLAAADHQLRQQSFEPSSNPFGKNPAAANTATGRETDLPGQKQFDGLDGFQVD